MSVWLGQRMPRYLVKHYFWVCLWECFFFFFLRGLVFELMDWVNHMAFPRVGGHHPIHQGPEGSKAEAGELALCLAAVGHTLICSCPWSWPLVLGFWTGIYTIHSLAFRPYTTPPAFLGFQCAESRLWDYFYSHASLRLINLFWCIYIYVCVCVYIYIYLVYMCIYIDKYKYIYI